MELVEGEDLHHHHERGGAEHDADERQPGAQLVGQDLGERGADGLGDVQGYSYLSASTGLSRAARIAG
jgi:hypothetical protein